MKQHKIGEYFSANRRISNATAKRWGQAIDSMAKHLKRSITPHDLVNDYLANRQSPFRDGFTKNVRKAAYKRWMDEARHILQVVKVYVLDDESKAVPARAFNKVIEFKGTTPKDVYVPVYRIQAEPDLHRQAAQSQIDVLKIWTENSQIYPALKNIVRFLKQAIPMAENALHFKPNKKIARK